MNECRARLSLRLTCPFRVRFTSRVGRQVREGILRFALAGSWPVVIPTGASPVEIRELRSNFSLMPNVARHRKKTLNRQAVEICKQVAVLMV